LALEAKLGLDRLAPAEFKRRFLTPVAVTGHKPQRVKGSMVAILNHRFPETIGALPLRTSQQPPVEIARPWFLVLRKAVWQRQWISGNRTPHELGPWAHVAIFEDIVLQHGDAASFDQLVNRLVGNNFFAVWDLGAQPQKTGRR
jgi:hypothetical protein